MAKTQKTQKEVTILNIYRFKNVSRICFEVLSSNGNDKYHTCFDGSAEKASCTCPGGESVRHHCYHMDGLKARAASYFAARQPEQPEPELTAEDIAELTDPDIEVMQPVKANPVQETEAFIAKVQAEKAQQAPAPRQQEDWSTPNGSLYRETRNYEIVNGRACPMR